MDFVSRYDKEHRQALILGDRDLTKSSCIETAVINDINYLENHADILINGEIVEEVPVFYHCQKSSKVKSGILAFTIGDEVIVDRYTEGQDEDKETKYIIFGFADNIPRLCKPLTAAIGFETTDPETLSYSVYRRDIYDNPVCTSRETWDVRGNLSFHQVRFLKQDFSYEKNSVDEEGNPITVTVDTEVIHSVGVAHGVVVDPGLNPDTVNISIILTTLDLNKWQYCRDVITQTYSGLSNEFSGHANLSEDGTKVYFVYAGSSAINTPQFYPDHTNSGSVVCETYEYQVDPDTEVGSWVLTNTDTFNFDYYTSPLFVSRDGTVRGLWKCTAGNVPIFEYASFDFFTGAVTSESSGCIGHTVYNGEFDWYSYTRSDVEGGYDHNYNDNFDDPGAKQSDYEPCERPECHDVCVYSGEPCGEYIPYEVESNYWCTLYWQARSIDGKNYSLGIGDNHLVSGSVSDSATFDGSCQSYTLYSLEYYCTYTCPPGDWSCFDIHGQKSCGYSYIEDQSTDSLGASFGAANQTKINNRDSISYFLDEDVPAEQMCYVTTWTPYTWDCGCTFAPGSQYSTLYYNLIYNTCRQSSIETPSFGRCDQPNYSCSSSETKFKSIHWPIPMSNASGRQAFCIYDQNSELEYKGQLWDDVDSDLVHGDTHWTIHENDTDKTTEIFDCTGFSLSGEHPFHHMIFLW